MCAKQRVGFIRKRSRFHHGRTAQGRHVRPAASNRAGAVRARPTVADRGTSAHPRAPFVRALPRVHQLVRGHVHGGAGLVDERHRTDAWRRPRLGLGGHSVHHGADLCLDAPRSSCQVGLERPRHRIRSGGTGWATPVGGVFPWVRPHRGRDGLYSRLAGMRWRFGCCG